MRYGIILLPGIINPADLAYGDLRVALSDVGSVVLKDLAVYDGEAPPAGYSLETEIDAVLETAEERGFARFHLVGYSAGGAIAAALAARHPERLVSLALLEPAWLGNEGMSENERRAFAEFDNVTALPPEQALPAFARLNLAPGVMPPAPPAGAPPPWMAKRPAGIRAIGSAFRHHRLETAALRKLAAPVLYVLGRLSNPALYAERAERARSLFADFTLEVFEDRHHFDPPQRAEPQRTAELLRAFWQRAEAMDRG